MPQGGIDEGEEPCAAAFRELREEIGTGNAEILAESRSWLFYRGANCYGPAWALAGSAPKMVCDALQGV
jgi:8-oxo-dGTP pyrophosphatase MutT (NUDIX family)